LINFQLFNFKEAQAVPIRVFLSQWIEAANWDQFTDQPRKY